MRYVLSLAFVLFACGPSNKPTNPTPPPSDPGSADPGSGAAGSGGEGGEGTGSATPGEADCMCTMQYDPVCGADGKTYGNACAAGCAKVEVKSKGECPK